MDPGWSRYELWWNAVLLDLRLRTLADLVGRLPAPAAGGVGGVPPSGSDEWLVAYA